MRTRVKICGLTRHEDVAAAVAAGVDAIGFVFHEPSPRAVTPEQARALCDVVPPFVTAVGLFVDADAARIRHILERVPLELLQFHGDEAPDFCAAFARRWIKAVRMRPQTDPRAERLRYRDAAGLLLDTYDPARAGGTGRRFDWDRIPAEMASSIILAGGLDATSVGDAIRQVRPFGVDVSGGVEAAKGVKDHDQIHTFMQRVTDVDNCR
ncbi:phosphoribosylanthranilate isomerase [Thiocapsa imhoffii]|uniref:N-(5'-phosphoribosyl)anthranilate isomerase n=1 Tax=Thiocapsa imhoffii TaxID=382777 RepID=A0A9X0WIH6_9GAMM|nr:phosphoribosylanthranilate isomerase [Thiocapsa imhoffii]MBK1645372.1 phosphoribosylanthranilate isomerase [Thiocapsa imhoffii]